MLVDAAFVLEADLEAEVVVGEIPADYCTESLVVPTVDHSSSDSAAGCMVPGPCRVQFHIWASGSTHAGSASTTEVDHTDHFHQPFHFPASGVSHCSIHNCSAGTVESNEVSVGAGSKLVLVPLAVKYSDQTSYVAGWDYIH